ncbi:DUF4291 domain-containing protein [Hazenella coriacea]|uniref:Uncharacterized protein DUF4291 n=1 Tax=Hazenella coriacea TaxID=1179467 RepID=A0A4R3L381_9BACL|nr:DUF4291 domain-containing protein [Hazenella coriacea]TCS93959.1 uncharacterized protein DUF4291 [Hazenella coriacea]
MNLVTEPYHLQQERWPNTGNHILAQYDDETIIVYQAYHPTIASFAIKHGYFGGPFKLSRMSWIKTNFLWMMYRSGWGRKENQEVTLAIRLKRAAFEKILTVAVHSQFVSKIYHTKEQWKKELQESEVRLQWDPDHDPTGNKVERRAIQLGLSGSFLEKYAREWIVEIQDISSFVEEQRKVANPPFTELIMPKEDIYPIDNE